MPRLYVDENLRVTDDVSLQKAIVNKVNGCFEITFFEPIGFCKARPGSLEAKAEWCEKNYPQYYAGLPRAESLLFANEGKLIFKSCCTSSNFTDYHGRIDYWYKIDSQGNSSMDCGEMHDNVYGALLLTLHQFQELNPSVDVEKYEMSVCY